MPRLLVPSITRSAVGSDSKSQHSESNNEQPEQAAISIFTSPNLAHCQCWSSSITRTLTIAAALQYVCGVPEPPA
jgi:hypothetical protein